MIDNQSRRSKEAGWLDFDWKLQFNWKGGPGGGGGGGGFRVGVAGVEAVVNETRPRVGSGVDRERVVRQMKRV